jgi:putative MATE family efflux protein
MILGMVTMMSFGLIDTFFVSLLGTEPLAAISFTFPVTFTVISLTIGLGIGTSAIIGRLRGEGDFATAKYSASGALILSALLVGILAFIGWLNIEPIFTVLGAQENLLSYIRGYMNIWYISAVFMAVPMIGNSILRASGDTKTPSIIMATGGAVNAFLDPILIFGLGPVPSMGIQGAALATLIAWAIGMLWVIYLLAVKRGLILARLPSWQEFIHSARSVLRIGVPAAGASILTPLAGGVLTAVVATYGPEAVAAWGVGNRLETFTTIVVLSLSMTLPPFISQNMGAGHLDRVEAAYRLVTKFILLWQAVIFVLIFLLSGVIASLFAKEAEVAALISLFLMIVPIGYGFQGIIILTNSSLNAMHLPMSGLVLSFIRLFVFYVPVAMLGSWLFGIQGVFMGAVVANGAMALVSWLWFKKTLLLMCNKQSKGDLV